MIIVEGPDNSGKSTLINQLIKDLGLTLAEQKVKGPTKSLLDITSRALDVLHQCSVIGPDKAITDRFSLISEEIYGPICRGQNRWNEDRGIYLSLWNIVDSFNPIIIYCRPPLPVLLNMDNHQVKDYDTKEHLESIESNQVKLIEKYDLFFKFHPCRLYDYTKENSYNDLINYLRSTING